MSSDRPASKGAFPNGAFPWGLTLAAAAVFIMLCGLGTWQLQRLAWKQGLLTHIDALSRQKPRPLGEALAAGARGENLEFVRVSFDCPGLAQAPFERLYALQDGKTGERLISACPLAGGGAILVDRGFLPDGARAPVVYDPTPFEPFRVTGVLRRPDPANAFAPKHKSGGRWFARDLPAIAQALSVPRAASYFVAVETPTNPEDSALIVQPIPANLSNRHLGYAITWFGLAAALAGVYAALLRQKLKPQIKAQA